MKEVLVTGGAGYVGSGVVRALLAMNYKVVCVDKLLFGGESIIDLLSHDNFQFYNCDLNDYEKVEGIFKSHSLYAVMHLAAIVGDPACAMFSNEATKTNWHASVNLFETAKSHGIERFVFASTCSNYGKMKNSDSYVNEESPLAPVSLYAELKVQFEKYMLEKMNYINSIAPTALRFSTVYGLSNRMRFDLTVNEFTKELALGRELVVFGEQFWRPYCHVRDFARAFLTIIESDIDLISGEVFNVGETTENYTKKMLVDEIIKVIPAAKIKYVEKNEDPRDYRVNFSKIQKTLGFEISARVADGINEIYQVISDRFIQEPDNQKYFNIPKN